MARMTTQSTMKERVQDIIDAAGDALAPSDGLDPVGRLEMWLDLPEAPQPSTFSFDVTTSMEECAPMPDPVYKSLGELLCAVWRPKDTNVALHNMLVEKRWKDPVKDSNLYDAMDFVRMTRILRHWMDLNINGSSRNMVTGMDDGDGNGDDTGNNQTLSTKLLEVTRPDNPSVLHPVVAALYYHIEQLPLLQGQIHMYSQSLSRPDRQKSTSWDSQTTASRLQQYQNVQVVKERLLRQWDEHTARLEYIVGEWYASQPGPIRRQCRAHMGSVWASFLASSGVGGFRTENTTSTGVQITLRVLLRILQGMNTIDMRSCDHLLMKHLMPLHKPNSMVLWRDQTSLLELYHEQLVQCIAAILQRNRKWMPKVINTLLDVEIWPKNESNTPKLVLLLHEIDTYIGILAKSKKLDKDALAEALVPLLSTLGRCMSSDHSRLAERALTFFKNKTFLALVELNFDQAVYMLLPFMVRREASWNPTVRKMTYNVLKQFEMHDAERFYKISDRVFANRVIDLKAASAVANADGHKAPRKNSERGGSTKTKGIDIASNKRGDNVVSVADFSLKAGMGDWKPTALSGSSSLSKPPSSRPGAGMMPPPAKRVTKGAPPVTVTGVAPWAMGNKKLPSATPASMNRMQGSRDGKAPPLTVTGVAPWAMKPKAPAESKRPTPSRPPSTLQEESSNDTPSSQADDDPSMSPHYGSERVRQYMKKVKPPEEVEGSSVWAKAQMAESPTLLPDLKFHGLVFGHELGHGAFGSVKYARLINKTKTRSQWAEYAVKIVSTEKIKELGYETSVQREIAVLRILSHPGIARLISSFRFREGVYLVLEYASGGDLHSLLKKHGSLDEESARFVIGEIVAGLSSVHDMGLVYGDLKPENVVITETGHIKLTDFGGCRPVTASAKERVASSSRNLLKELRDGDWKTNTTAGSRKANGSAGKSFAEDDEMNGGGDNDDQNSGWGGYEADGGGNNDGENGGEDEDEMETDPIEEDIRIEGTTAYLPPEVVLGEIPTFMADSWALGCVLFQCLSGRPPILEDDDEATRHKIVTFDSNRNGQHDAIPHGLFTEKHSSKISDVAQTLILRLLNRSPMNRPNMQEVARDAFFESTNVFSLHQEKAYPLDVGEVAPVADSQWSRRQFSSIWAPQPKAYDVGLGGQAPVRQRHSFMPTGPIAEKDEAGSLFSKALLAGVQGSHITDMLPLPS
eukprot:CAMPEP_0119546228 /NCGR_PEP_ID=MMETSP1352-20130426/733_1 /TAXON_ID=265584 /ORGANISM="Stauroneis constricta, Strain CCMP1120" /LENGTH=1198 /DNA_ID=CAMNT_0007590907 /DNA_START=24 /DNA_END=3620 /DNA_ORIENTATION=-